MFYSFLLSFPHLHWEYLIIHSALSIFHLSLDFVFTCDCARQRANISFYSRLLYEIFASLLIRYKAKFVAALLLLFCISKYTKKKKQIKFSEYWSWTERICCFQCQLLSTVRMSNALWLTRSLLCRVRIPLQQLQPALAPRLLRCLTHLTRFQCPAPSLPLLSPALSSLCSALLCSTQHIANHFYGAASLWLLNFFAHLIKQKFRRLQFNPQNRSRVRFASPPPSPPPSPSHTAHAIAISLSSYQ